MIVVGKTILNIKGRDFYINDKPVYDEIEGSGSSKGLLMNARFIQGIFDDASGREKFNRFNKSFDPDKNTDELISALPKWYEYGLRAVTVGFQGGMPVFTIDIESIDNNPFSSDGNKLDDAYAKRMDKIIKAADALGMVVIVNILYWAQTLRLNNEDAIISALKCAASFLKEGGYTNVIIDVANEYNIDMWKDIPLVKDPNSMQLLIDIVRKESGGMLVGASGGGGLIDKEVVEASDVVIIHGNGLTRGEYYDFILKVQEMAPNKPILCNEDSPCISRLEIAKLTHTSWGHYDNFTKQEPPCDWNITEGQDMFFARRMAASVGSVLKELPLEEQFYLQGLENNTQWEGKRWIRLAAEHPEMIDYVNFFRNGEFIYRSYDEPFFMYRETTWIQKSWEVKHDDRKWTAEIVLNDGTIIIKSVKV